MIISGKNYLLQRTHYSNLFKSLTIFLVMKGLNPLIEEHLRLQSRTLTSFLHRDYPATTDEERGTINIELARNGSKADFNIFLDYQNHAQSKKIYICNGRLISNGTYVSLNNKENEGLPVNFGQLFSRIKTILKNSGYKLE